ncbi:uncharacterized protein MELLADRAFT_107604 [Melampsora larici-populina 98AG31]|uniref:SH3 domain-containing protein n=1 Tax=Melampsora larici-populina (strain 98AG31 / pathotype 3-4-7) TaxID=747676 RepID=F4RQ66_MELLP|nr:uncharacterized protein MELLADRAFT_107604 [Melampsora larici-populina 98AG31]EGG05353.1 hypothetical protein MELLADRAFT_107604 [Melampsora larici-populina 98AG31]
MSGGYSGGSWESGCGSIRLVAWTRSPITTEYALESVNASHSFILSKAVLNSLRMEKLRRGQFASNPAISNQIELLRTRAVESEDELSKMDKRQNPDHPSRPTTENAHQTTSKPASDPKEHVKSPPTQKKSQNKQHNEPTKPHKTTHTATNKKEQHRPNHSHNQQANQKHVPQRQGSNQKHVPSTKHPNNHKQHPPPHQPVAAVQHKAPPPPAAPVHQPVVKPAVVPRPHNVAPAPVQQDKVLPPPQVAAPLPVGNQNPVPIPVPIVKPENTSDKALPTLPVVSAVTTPNNSATVPVQDEGKNTSQGSSYSTLAVQNGNNTHNSNVTSPFVDPTPPEKVWGQSAISDSTTTGLSKAEKAAVIFCVPLGALILSAALYKLWKIRRSKRSRVESILVTRSRPTTISDVIGGHEAEESSFGHHSAFHSMQNGSQRNSSYHSANTPPMPINVAMPMINRGSDEKLKEKPINRKHELMEPNLNIRGNDLAFIRQSEETGYEDSLETRVMSHDANSQSGNIAIVARTFDPFLPDELVINPGDRVRVEMVYDDGWCFGTNLDADRHRTSGGSAVVSTGVFPQDCLQRPTDTDSVSDRSLPDANASCLNTYHTFGNPESGTIECLETTQQSPIHFTPRSNKVPDNLKSDQTPKPTPTKSLSEKPPRVSSMIQDRDTQLLQELDTALNL